MERPASASDPAIWARRPGTVDRDHRELGGPRSPARADQGADLEGAERRGEQPVVLGHALGRDGEQVPTRQAHEEALELGRREVREERADRCLPLREDRGGLGPRLPALERPLQLRHELAHERRPPRGPRGRARRRRVRHGEEVQGGQALRRPDPRRHPEQEVLVPQVAAGRGVPEEQVLGDEEPRELPRGIGRPHASEDAIGELAPDRHVAAPAHLADVVEERPEQQALARLA
ncbi:MAG: hypothetical protein KatS3mg014_0211 [Actinomycetota bacterium]|nr:MAG: hypothetical protein KatS3mg014_0211 [Actinomycetota bacterium]